MLAPGIAHTEPVTDRVSIEVDGTAVAAFAGHAGHGTRSDTIVFKDGWFSEDTFRAWVSAPDAEVRWLLPGAHAPGKVPCRALNLTVSPGTEDTTPPRSAKPAPPLPEQRSATVLIDACPVSWTVRSGNAPGAGIRMSELRVRFREIGTVR